MTKDLTSHFGISAENLSRYEQAGIIKPIHVDGAVYYEGLELCLEVIAKAERLGFSVDEIIALIKL